MLTYLTWRYLTIQNEIRVIIPNLNPNKAIKWLMSRATTKTGSPYFFGQQYMMIILGLVI